METNHENINNHCNNRTTAHISHKHVHSTLQTTLIQMMLFVWVTPQRCGRKVDRTLCLCIYGKECRIDRTLYSTLLNSTHFFSVVDRTPTHYFWSTGWEVISKSPSHYSMPFALTAIPCQSLPDPCLSFTIRAVCYKNEGCQPKYINSKIYIDDELYESMQQPYMRQNITKKLGM